MKLVQIPSDDAAELIDSKVVLNINLGLKIQFDINTNHILLTPFQKAEDYKYQYDGGVTIFPSLPNKLLFDPSDGLLKMCLFDVAGSAIGKEVAQNLSSIFTKPQVSGTLYLPSVETFSTEDSWEPRHMLVHDDDRVAIISMLGGYDNQLTDIYRLNLCQDFELLINDNILSGWILYNPVHYLVEEFYHPDTQDNPCLDALLPVFEKYIKFIWKIDDPSYDKIPAHDLEFKTLIDKLYLQLDQNKHLTCSQAKALKNSFYFRQKLFRI